VVVRSRRGGERLRIAGNRPARALKALLRDAGIPAWMRSGVPLVYCGDELAAVPGIGVDPRFAATSGGEGFELAWNAH
jgi:tRNA(Ile)-lysidine synthase